VSNLDRWDGNLVLDLLDHPNLSTFFPNKIFQKNGTTRFLKTFTKKNFSQKISPVILGFWGFTLGPDDKACRARLGR